MSVNFSMLTDPYRGHQLIFWGQRLNRGWPIGKQRVAERERNVWWLRQLNWFLFQPQSSYMMLVTVV